MAMLVCCQQWSLPMPLSELQKAAQHRYRAKQKALGIKPVTTPEYKAIRAARVAAKRAEAKVAGIVLPTDQWAKKNPGKQRARVSKWRDKNPERSAELTRLNQASRRSTPWGQINNRMWPSVHRGVRAKKSRWGQYNNVLGYLWSDLRTHLESQFLEGMMWENWGDVWELDHIKPLSSFRYTSINDPLFLECWSLSNLRPLWRDANAKKSAKYDEGETIASNA